MPSEAQELVGELVSLGASQRSIAGAVGRNSSLISQVARGVKPGNNLVPALRELRATAAAAPAGQARTAVRGTTVAEPTRRTTRAGRLARVRRPATVRGRNWSSTTVKRTAAGSGGRAMLHPIAEAADRGQTVAVTVGLAPSVPVHVTYARAARKHAVGTRPGHSVTIELGPADEVFDALHDYADNVSAYVLDRLAERGDIGPATPADVRSMELRAY